MGIRAHSNHFILSLLALFNVSCASQHYIVKSTEGENLDQIEYKIQALASPNNGYSLQIKNLGKHDLLVDWDEIQIRDTNGFEVTTAIDTTTPVNTIHTQSKVKYHVKPTQRYYVNKDHDDFGSFFWGEFASWPSAKRLIFVPYCFRVTHEGADKSCKTGIIKTHEVHSSSFLKDSEEEYRWLSPGVYAKSSKKRFHVGLNVAYLNLPSYSIGSVFEQGLNIGVSLTPNIKVLLLLAFGGGGYQNNIELTSFNRKELRSEIALFNHGVLDLGISGSLFHLASEYSIDKDFINDALLALDKTYDGYQDYIWDQGEYLWSAGLFASLSLPLGIKASLHADYGQQIGDTVINSQHKENLDLIGVSQRKTKSYLNSSLRVSFSF